VSALTPEVAYCSGEFSIEDGEKWWREGCEDCLRRTATGHWGWINPPAIVVFECERRIGPGDLPLTSPS